MLVYKHYSIGYAINLFQNPDNGLWFLIVLFFIQVWYLAQQYITSRISYKKNSWLIEGITGCLFLSMIYVLNKCNNICSGLYTNYNLYIMFFAGSFFAKHLMSVLKNDMILLLSIMGFVVLVPKFHMWQTNSSLVILAVSLFASFVIIRISMALESMNLKCNKLLAFGKSSLAIYAFHFFFIKILVGTKVDVSDISLMPLFVILTLIGIFICNVCVKISDVISQIHLLNRLLLGRK